MRPQEQPASRPSGCATWDDAGQTVIRVDLSLAAGATVTAEERTQHLLEAADLAASVTHPVDFLVDLRNAGYLPSGNWLELFRRLNERLPDNAGVFVVVGSRAPRLFQNVVTTLGRFQRMRAAAVFVATLDEAQAVLARRRADQSHPSEH